MGVNMQHKFLEYLRFKRSLLACDEVKMYGNIADVIAIDKNKKLIYEFEFKKSVYDLKVLEPKKLKYKRNSRKPHKFYYVVPEMLWHKEMEYFKNLKDCGVIMYYLMNDKLTFLTVKPCKIRTCNLQDYDYVHKKLFSRVTSAYVALIRKFDKLMDKI